MVEQTPQGIMSEAAAKANGILITFRSYKELLKFRFRCYGMRRRMQETDARLALEAGTPPTGTGWEDLVFLPRGIKNEKLWIGVPTAATFGIVKIETVNGK